MKMKKLLASALAAALVVSSMVGTIVTSAATKVGTITAETVNVTAGQTDTVEAEVNITFDKGVVAPHNFITVALEGYELTDVALGDVTYATDAQGKVSIDKEYCDLDAGKILIEAPVDATAPTVTAITLTVTFTDVDDVDTAAGEYDIVVNADDMSDVDEADLTLDAVNGKLIVAAAHEHDFVPTVTDPTCTEQGYTTFNCACGKDSYVGEYTDALGHNYVGEVTKAPDCDDAGVKTYTCSRCQHSYTEAIDALGHKPVEIPAVDATCTTDGATAGVKCDVCDAIITAPTTIPALGHTAGEPVEENRVEAKPGVAGSYDTVVYCTVCKAEISRTTNEIPALPDAAQPNPELVFYRTSLAYGTSSLELNFRIANSVLDLYDNVEVVIIPQKYDMTTLNLVENPTEIVVAKKDLAAAGSKYKQYTYTDIQLYELGLNIDYMLRAYEGDKLVAFSETFTMSAANYLKDMAADTTKEAGVRAMFVDTLVVCDEVMKNVAKSYSESDLAATLAAGSVLDGVDMALATQTIGECNTVNDFVSYDANFVQTNGATHQIRSSVAIGKVPYINFRVKDQKNALDLNKLEINVKYTSVDSAGEHPYNKTFSGAALTDGTFINCVFAEIGFHDSNKDILFTVSYDGEKKCEWTYSIETYLYSMKDDATAGSQMIAIIKLGQSFRSAQGL